MTYWGRLIGTVLALMIFKNLFAAFIGFFIGAYFDKAFARTIREGFSGASKKTIHAQFIPFLFSSLGYLAKADGRISEDEISHVEDIMKHYGFDNQTRDQAIRWFQEGAKQENRYDELLKSFAQAIQYRPGIKKVTIELLISLAMADGVLHHREEDILLKIALALGVPEQMFRILLGQLKGQQAFSHGNQKDALSEAYKVLGVSDTDNNEVIKKAYRKLMSEHHPDKLIAQGVPEEAIRLATEKSQVIQAAYELIKKQRQ